MSKADEPKVAYWLLSLMFEPNRFWSVFVANKPKPEFGARSRPLRRVGRFDHYENIPETIASIERAAPVEAEITLYVIPP